MTPLLTALPIPDDSDGLTSLTPGLGAFALIYCEAAERLAECRSDPGSVDDIPIVFLYRHAIETSMKHLLISRGNEFNITTTPNDVLGRSHDLAKQLNDVRTLAERANKPLSSATEEFIRRFQSSDDTGAGCRYPEAKNGDLIMIEHIASFSLSTFLAEARSVTEDRKSVV